MSVADDDARTVAGEDRAHLLEAVRSMTRRREADGTLTVEFDLPPHLGEPFARALDRIADAFAADDERRGVPVRRRPVLHAAAFKALLLRVEDPQ